jgi:hypothetical protein
MSSIQPLLGNGYKPPAHEILDWFWSNRAALYRSQDIGSGGPGANYVFSTYPGDAFTGGGHYNSYSYIDYNINVNFGTPTVNASRVFTNYWTIILFGDSNNWSSRPFVGGNFTNGTYGTFSSILSGNFNVLGTITQNIVSATPNNVAGTYSWNNWDGADNLGCSFGAIALPGRWAQAGSTTSVQSSFNLPPGRIAVFQSNEGRASGMSASGGVSFYGMNDWYRTPGFLLQFNNTANTIACTNSGSMASTGNQMVILYNLDNDS